ncbi:hypothetical protein FC756_21880 [Lysinibacillus mangiferihumi]|uniref:Uncharacterized protein n=1 Tax=Lysinibacillus mangiferihumi TaxID=1130819 RepID=A0A4U2Y1F9_9BACI|nr:ABC transporter permease [Lysinibacillus mangiferihumi]TKI53824.1 hypothetical protein FC756_21880 [Lysinibacillus mangiferihumi]
MSFIEEFKKIKGSGAYILLAVLLLLPICIQGVLGLGPIVTDYKYYVTTFGLFCRLFLSVAIGLLISLSFYNEYRRKGYLNVILNGHSFANLIINKMLFFYTFILVYLLTALFISLGFQLFDGSNIGLYYKELLISFSFLFITSILLINIHMFLCMFFNQHTMISLIISVLCSFLNVFIVPTQLWIMFPWSYPTRILYFASLNTLDFVTILLITICSFALILYYNSINVRST